MIIGYDIKTQIGISTKKKEITKSRINEKTPIMQLPLTNKNNGFLFFKLH